MSLEKDVWKGSPSHWTSFLYYIVCVPLIFCFGIGLLMGIWRYLTIRTWKISITTQRVINEKGVLSKTTDELELFRVKDITLDQPFFLRLVGLSNIILYTSDKTTPIVTIPGVPNGKKLREELRSVIDKRRDEKGVRERDFE